MTYLTGEWTQAQLIVRADGLLIDDVARNALIDSGAHQDDELGGFVVSEGGMPWFYMALFPAHELIVLPVSVPYNPEWFGPVSPPPVFEDLPPVFDGVPHSEKMMVSWFIRKGNMKPFMAQWGKISTKGKAEWDADGQLYTPEETVRDGWIVIATMSEVMQMTNTRIDEANRRRASHAELEAIVNDAGGKSAWRVGVETGRIFPDLLRNESSKFPYQVDEIFCLNPGFESDSLREKT